MTTYIIRRVLLAVPTLMGITFVTFLIINLAPGDPAELQMQQGMNPTISARVYADLREHFGLDKPLLVRYGLWLGRICTLDFGTSFADGRKVSTKIGRCLWPTLSLALLSLVIAFALSVPIGIYSATRPNGVFDTTVSTFLYALFSVPSYVMAMVLILVIGVQLDWLPFRGMTGEHYDQLSLLGRLKDLAAHYVLILICYAYPALAFKSRFVRSNMLEVIHQDYIRTARAKGLAERPVILRHAFRNTLIPLVTMLGLMLPSILAGSVILEVMFSWPGIGRLFYDAIFMRDYPVVMALSFITAVLVLLGMLLADLAYAFVDPRVSYD
jgi:peptide/nickel transport system permease protein